MRLLRVVGGLKEWSGGRWIDLFQVVMSLIVPVIVVAVVFLQIQHGDDQRRQDATARRASCRVSVVVHAQDIAAYTVLAKGSPYEVRALQVIDRLRKEYDRQEAACFHTAEVAHG